MVGMESVQRVVMIAMMEMIRFILQLVKICDGQVNECGGSLPLNEIDNDGYVECAEHNEGWDGVSITGFEDCDDDNDTIYPSAPELCDGLINTCGGSLPANESDVDNDGYVECAEDAAVGMVLQSRVMKIVMIMMKMNIRL